MIRSKKYGVYHYEKDIVEAYLYSSFACDGGCALACISEAARYQTGEYKEVNGSRILNTVYPAWKAVYARNFSLFDAIYEKVAAEVGDSGRCLRRSGPPT